MCGSLWTRSANNWRLCSALNKDITQWYELDLLIDWLIDLLIDLLIDVVERVRIGGYSGGLQWAAAKSAEEEAAGQDRRADR